METTPGLETFGFCLNEEAVLVFTFVAIISFRLVGVVGVARVSGETASTDVLTLREKVATFILIIASLNLFVGMFNLLPLLPLDGGHMAVAIADGVRNFLARRSPHLF